MSFGRRSQANIISAVLITAILLAAVIGTYIWAQPIMVKAYDKRRIDYAKDMLSSIKQAIEDSAFQQGQKVIPVEFDKGSLKITKDRDTDEYVIDYEIQTNVPMLASTRWIAIDGNELPIQENSRYTRSWCVIKEPNTNDGWDDENRPFGIATFDCEFTKYNDPNQQTLKKAYDSCMTEKLATGKVENSGFAYSRENIKIGDKEYKAILCSASPTRNYVCLLEIKKPAAGVTDFDYLGGVCQWKAVGSVFRDLGDDHAWRVEEIHRESDAILGLRLSAGFKDKLGEKDRNSPCIIIGKSKSKSEMRTAVLRIKCRPVIDTQENIAYDIVLKPGEGALVASPGEHRITVKYAYDKTLHPQKGQHWVQKQIFVEITLE